MPHILIVENDADDAVRLHNILSELRDPINHAKCEISIARDIDDARKYLARDDIDIYIVDLIMAERARSNIENEKFGKDFVREIATRSNAGIVVCSSLPATTESAQLLEDGADDYVWKYPPTSNNTMPEIMRARVRSVWRRVQLARSKTSHQFAHTGRVFMVGHWRFMIGDRTLIKRSGESVRLSPTEHAFLRYICAIEDHEANAESFAQQVLYRDPDEHFRLDNLVYRLKNKLGESVQLLSQRGGTYKLTDVKELKPGTN